MATKNDPGPFDCYAALAPDEPYFILKSTDELAPEVVEGWADLYIESKRLEGGLDERAQKKYREALEVCEAMRVWKRLQAGRMQAQSTSGDDASLLPPAEHIAMTLARWRRRLEAVEPESPTWFELNQCIEDLAGR